MLQGHGQEFALCIRIVRHESREAFWLVNKEVAQQCCCQFDREFFIIATLGWRLPEVTYFPFYQ